MRRVRRECCCFMVLGNNSDMAVPCKSRLGKVKYESKHAANGKLGLMVL